MQYVEPMKPQMAASSAESGFAPLPLCGARPSRMRAPRPRPSLDQANKALLTRNDIVHARHRGQPFPRPPGVYVLGQLARCH